MFCGSGSADDGTALGAFSGGDDLGVKCSGYVLSIRLIQVGNWRIMDQSLGVAIVVPVLFGS